MKSALIIVDDPVIRLRLLRLLGRYGWWVDAVAGGERALACLDEVPRDVVLIDYQVGSDSGLSLLMAIKMHAVWRSVPTIVLHDGAAWTEIERALEIGANDFLAHSFTDEAALRKLDRWVLDKPEPAGFELVG